MKTSSEAKDVLRERRAEAAELEQKAVQAERLEGELASLRRDLERMFDRQHRFAGLGDDRLEIVQKSPHPNCGVVEWEPLRSRFSGKEMAAGVQPNIDSLKSEIAWREKTIKTLLGK